MKTIFSAAIFLSTTAPLLFGLNPQTIAFDPIPNQIFGVSPFLIAAQASSGLPVSFASTTPGVCKTASDLVIILSPGPCFITASQPGNGIYSAATPVTRNFTVNVAKPSAGLTPAAGAPFGTGKFPFFVVGDFNGDGIQDLAVANYRLTPSGGTITVLLGNGTGFFTAATGSPFMVGINPVSLVAGDFNGDGIQDLATANAGSDSVTVLLGNGSGGFTEIRAARFQPERIRDP